MTGLTLGLLVLVLGAFAVVVRYQSLLVGQLNKIESDLLTNGGDTMGRGGNPGKPDLGSHRPQPVVLSGGVTVTHVHPPGHETETVRLLHDLLNQVSIIETQIGQLIAAVATLTEDPAKLQQVSTQLAALTAKAKERTAQIKATVEKNA